MSTETIQFHKDEAGIVTLTMDDPSQSANTMRSQFVVDYATIAARLVAEKDGITGIILTSAKKTFFAGGDLKELSAAGPEQAGDVSASTAGLQASMVAIETLGKPVVAALNGTALGGGFELALGCHHRIAIAGSRAVFGLPEVTLGLLPGGGGIVRTVRMLGVVNALMNVLLKGPQMRAEKAHGLGLIDQLVEDEVAMLQAARAFIEANPASEQPWRGAKYRIPGGAPSHPKLASTLPAVPSTLRSQLKGAHYDAPHHIVAAAVESAMVDIDRAFEIERRYFVDLVCNSQQSKNMTQAFFFDLQSINKGGSRPEGYPRWKAEKVAVLGAGMMGAGIAYQCAKSGIEVVLKDISQENAERGKGYSAKLVDKGVRRGKVTAEKGQALLDRITPTADVADLAGCDLVIEAVFESPSLKKKVFAEVLPHLAPDALLASNTSTLPVTDLATGVDRPADFLGLHFFSPVDKMPLVEIVRGEQTSDAALAKAVDLVLQIRKTPIVVNDSRGFFTSRVIAGFLNEAVAALAEGVPAIMIERAGLAAGYPAPPLQLMDELTLTLPLEIAGEYAAAAEAAGQPHQAHPALAVLQQMVDAERGGRSSGAGFYHYEGGKRAGLWSGLQEMFPASETSRDIAADDARLFVDLQERMMFAEAIETVRCFDEGVLTSVADANIGSIFGIGFPAWTGGIAQYIDQYDGGTAGFVARCAELAATYGPRFTAPASLVAAAEAGRPFRDPASRW